MADTVGLGSSWKVAALAASAAGISGLIASYLLTYRKNGAPARIPQKWIRVGTVSQLFLYPVKSCQGLSVKEASATTLGLKANDFLRDRVFLVVDSRSVFQTQRTIPRLVLIKVDVQGNRLTLSAPEMAPLTLTVPEDSPNIRKSCRIFQDTVALALDCGDEVGKWLDTFLNQTGFRLLYHPALDKTQRAMNQLQKKFPLFAPGDKGSFQDQTSFMMIAEESIAELNKKLDQPVSHRNFRPSILIKGVPEAFAEDLWSYVRFGGENGPIMKHAKPCTRCKLTTVNPDTAVFSEINEPLRTLATIQRKYGDDKTNGLVKREAVLGNQMGLCRAGATIKVGDPVYAAAL